MNISSRKRILAMGAYLGFAASAGAQPLAASAVNSPSMSESATQAADLTTDQELRERVQAALHAAPYLYDRHIRVSVDHGVVALHGFVFSAWDLQDAMHVANQAVHGNRVVDNLSIYEVDNVRR